MMVIIPFHKVLDQNEALKCEKLERSGVLHSQTIKVREINPLLWSTVNSCKKNKIKNKGNSWFGNVLSFWKQDKWKKCMTCIVNLPHWRSLLVCFSTSLGLQIAICRVHPSQLHLWMRKSSLQLSYRNHMKLDRRSSTAAFFWNSTNHLRKIYKPWIGTRIFMVYMGGSAFPRLFLVITLGSPPHMIGWLNPPVMIEIMTQRHKFTKPIPQNSNFWMKHVPLNPTPNLSFGTNLLANGL